MHHSMVMFTFSVLDQKYHFLGKLGPKYQNYWFKDIINPDNCFSKKDNFSVKTTNAMAK